MVPEELYPWLNLASGAARRRDRRSAFGRACAHARAHSPRPPPRHDHHHHVTRTTTTHRRRASLVAVGISGGLFPCPSALVVLLAAISLHRVGFGLVLIVAFSVGLGRRMTGIGLVAVSAKRVFERVDFDAGSCGCSDEQRPGHPRAGLVMIVRAPSEVHRSGQSRLDTWIAHFSDGATWGWWP